MAFNNSKLAPTDKNLKMDKTITPQQEDRMKFEFGLFRWNKKMTKKVELLKTKSLKVKN
jgi:hypothetical protein